MNKIRIKICGITRSKDANAAVELGADALGFIFFPKSPRFIGLAEAKIIVSSISPFIAKVGLFVNPSRNMVETCIKNVGIDTLQFHGDESPEFCNTFGLPWIKTISVGDNADLEEEIRSYKDASAYLFDTKKVGCYGGTGQTFNWNLIPKGIDKPFIVAGGLKLDNIEEAARIPDLYAVDVCSGVEEEKGIKSMSLMRDFIEKVNKEKFNA